MKRRALIQGVGAGLLLPEIGFGQDHYPSKVINWICPYGAGGGADQRSRQVAKVMGTLLGVPIIVDNKSGAGGNIGTAAIAKAPADGYTLGMGNFAPMSVNQALFKKLPFDPIADIAPIMLIERGPLILTVKYDSPYKNVKELVAAAKLQPGKLSYASGGIGGTHHLSGALFEHVAGIDMIHAPYKSGSAAATDLMGGQVSMMFEQMYAAMPGIKAGKIRALAITSKQRSPLMRDLPTMAEAGFPEVEVMNWQGLIGPKGLSNDIIKVLNTAANKALTDAGLREQILSQGNEIAGGSPEQFAALIRLETPRWSKVVRDAKIDPE